MTLADKLCAVGVAAVFTLCGYSVYRDVSDRRAEEARMRSYYANSCTYIGSRVERVRYKIYRYQCGDLIEESGLRPDMYPSE